ncbi:MAG: DUF2063 domain-containing protein [Variovorax sp.]|nr:MAG: DUF2063 domain-containing protein [Variovorax sp.]
MSLASFQAAFAAALFADQPPTGIAAQPAFAVYRNTVMKGCIDALAANFPCVVRLVGDEWFRAAAALHVVAEPPRDARLLSYGEGFAGFLATFEPAQALPYLADVAQLDRYWTEAHTAADAPAVDTNWLAALAPDALGALRLAPHPAARWQWFSHTPIFSIWQRNRTGDGLAQDLPWQGEGALLSRPGDAVDARAASQAGCAFMDACAAGGSLGDAAAAALAAQSDTDLAGLLARLLRAGALIHAPDEVKTP